MPDPSQRERHPVSPESPPLGNGIFLFFLLLFFLSLLFPHEPNAQRVPYSQFIDRVEAGQVARVEIGPSRIQFELKGPATDKPASETVFFTIPVEQDTQLPALLRERGVEFEATPTGGAGLVATLLGWIIPPVIFFSIWAWMFNQARSNGPAALPFGKSKARIYAEGSSGITFDDVAGVDEAKEELQELVSFLRDAAKYTRLGAKIPKGVLLVGPPGTGKTLLARAIAGEAGVPFFSISGSEFIELFVGVGASRVRDLFDRAKQEAPCIVFIDELDALGKSRAAAGPFVGGNDEREQTLNQLLAELDGFDPNSGVILLAATNRPEVLDPALLRPGRFNRQVLVDRPDRSGREAILKVHARGVQIAPEVDLAKLAARTPGFAGADLANLINEAALLAVRRDRNAVTMADFNEAIERVLAGLEKKSRILNEVEQKTVAHHEVGHAIVGALMPGMGSVEKISVVPRGAAALGYTLQVPEEDRFLMGEDELRGRLATLLGGRAAEESIFHKVSTGASDDIQKATDLAERFVTLYGMSDALGPVAFEKPQPQFLDGYPNPRRAVSPQVSEAIDREVKALIDGAHAIALKIVQHNQPLLLSLAQQLLEREVLEGAELRSQLATVTAPPELQQWLESGQLPNAKSTQLTGPLNNSREAIAPYFKFGKGIDKN